MVGEMIAGPVGIRTPPGGSRTTGRDGSMKLPFLDIIEPTGETMLSRAMDDRLLRATLGEETLPPYALVRLLEKPLPPIEPNRPRPRPKPCWIGRSARGMKMNDRSTVGKIYRGADGGSEMRTGLSRRSGGRCFGKRVCDLMGTFWKVIGAFMLGRRTRTTALWVCTVVEKLRVWGGFEAGAGSARAACCEAFGACCVGASVGGAGCECW